MYEDENEDPAAALENVRDGRRHLLAAADCPPSRHLAFAGIAAGYVAASGLPHLCDKGLLRNLPVESTNSRFEAASRLLRSPCPFKQQCHLAVGANYGSLLEGDESAEAYPAASHWNSTGDTDEENRVLHCRKQYMQKAQYTELPYDGRNSQSVILSEIT